LADRDGFCDLIGVPEGRNHYYDLSEQAKAELAEGGEKSEWGYYHWRSDEILPASEIAAAKRDLDALTYEQEYGGSFVNFEGRAYYSFTDKNKASLINRYDPKQLLIICLDFNVAPGVAVIAQEMTLPVGGIEGVGTGVIGEVWIDRNSNTPAVCRKILTDWGSHSGRVEVYGDATGGLQGSAKVEGSDWDLVKLILAKGDPQQSLAGFGQRVSFLYHNQNPAERVRVNAVNSRTLSADGTIRLMVDASKAPHLAKDFEGVRTLKGGSGEIDKKHDPKLTHPTDALGYYIEYRFPIVEAGKWGTSTWKM
jgi:hypothetical protein